MRLRPLHILATCLALLACPTVAAAATAPVLVAPAATGMEFKVGGSISFQWTGALQGDPDALDRSSFRVEIAKVADVPSGAQAAWETTEDFRVTAGGAAETEATMGVPGAGTYRWRVCAWGVADDLVANVVQQLPGGCSTARTFTSVAASSAVTTIGQLDQKTTVKRPGVVKVVEVERPEPVKKPQAVKPVVVPEPVVVAPPRTPANFQEVVTRSGSDAGSAVDLGEDLSADTAAGRERGGVGSAISDGLGATLPFVPIPFWTLALLAACFPIARAWRRNVLTMFEWPDGSIDGISREPIDLLDAQHALVLMDVQKSTDGPAQALAPAVEDRHRIAA